MSKDADFTTQLSILLLVRNMIGEEKRWLRGGRARDSEGFPVDPLAEDACAFDLLGALMRATRRVVNPGGGPNTPAENGMLDELEMKLARRAGGRHIEVLNDLPGHTHADVLEWIDGLIDEYKRTHKKPAKKPR